METKDKCASHFPLKKWQAAAIANSQGYEPPEVKFLIRLAPDVLFKTAEDVQKLLKLDYVPETFEAYDVNVKKNTGRTVPIKYCLLPGRDYAVLQERTEFADEFWMINLDGQDRSMDTPIALRRKTRK